MRRSTSSKRTRHWWATGLAALLLFVAPVEARGPWLHWKNCTLDENDSNDGDSFHVKAEGRKYIIRLYLVDAPETDAGFPERVAQQGKYFGITPAQCVQVGELAAKFMEETLARPFTVRTTKQNAMGRSNAPRYYAFVETPTGDLGEMLVANGLARVHGVAPAEDESGSTKKQKAKLRRLELEARRQKVGGWGATAGRMNARVLSAAASKGQDAFDAFFHPERAVRAQEQPLPESAPTSALRRPATKLPPDSSTVSVADGLLDPNTATIAELVKLPGIGPVLAGRIIEARPFKNADGLRRVKGIGKKKFAQIRPHFAPGL